MRLSGASPHAALGKLESRCPSPALPAPDCSSSTCTAFSSHSLFSRSSSPCIYFSHIWLVSAPVGPQKRLQQKPTLHEPAKHHMGLIYYRHFEDCLAAVAAAHGTTLSSRGRSWCTVRLFMTQDLVLNQPQHQRLYLQHLPRIN